jgi:hypothetical protein
MAGWRNLKGQKLQDGRMAGWHDLKCPLGVRALLFGFGIGTQPAPSGAHESKSRGAESKDENVPVGGDRTRQDILWDRRRRHHRPAIDQSGRRRCGELSEACRSRSHAEFTARIGVVLDEADESELWLSVVRDATISSSPEVERLRLEAMEFCAIFYRSNVTARSRSGR